MDITMRLTHFLEVWAERFFEQAGKLKERKKELQDQEQIAEEIQTEEQTSMLDFSGPEYAKVALKMEKQNTIEVLQAAKEQIQEVMIFFGKEKTTDKILEGDIESLKNIASLCSGLAAKITAETQMKDH